MAKRLHRWRKVFTNETNMEIKRESQVEDDTQVANQRAKQQLYQKE